MTARSDDNRAPEIPHEIDVYYSKKVHFHGFFFFFQAEDGIRSGHVTGVQTCALPILPVPRVATCGWLMIGVSKRAPRLPVLVSVNVPPARSEERRVGKECRSRWS